MLRRCKPFRQRPIECVSRGIKKRTRDLNYYCIQQINKIIIVYICLKMMEIFIQLNDLAASSFSNLAIKIIGSLKFWTQYWDSILSLICLLGGGGYKLVSTFLLNAKRSLFFQWHSFTCIYVSPGESIRILHDCSLFSLAFYNQIFFFDKGYL